MSREWEDYIEDESQREYDRWMEESRAELLLVLKELSAACADEGVRGMDTLLARAKTAIANAEEAPE